MLPLIGPTGTDQDVLAKLRGLSAEQVLRGAPAQPGANAPSYETTPVLDGKLITETAETAYKARRQPKVPFLAGSNSADTAGNRIRAATKDEFFARFGKWSEEAKAAYDPDGSTDLATLVSRANDDFGQAEPARFAASAFAANGSPAYLYRFSYLPAALRGKLPGAPHGGEISYVFGNLAAGRGARRRQRIWQCPGSRKATGSTSPGRATRMVRVCRSGRATIPRRTSSLISDPMARQAPDPIRGKRD